MEMRLQTKAAIARPGWPGVVAPAAAAGADAGGVGAAAAGAGGAGGGGGGGAWPCPEGAAGGCAGTCAGGSGGCAGGGVSGWPDPGRGSLLSPSGSSSGLSSALMARPYLPSEEAAAPNLELLI
jgi:hypothetical protein